MHALTGKGTRVSLSYRHHPARGPTLLQRDKLKGFVEDLEAHWATPHLELAWKWANFLRPTCVKSGPGNQSRIIDLRVSSWAQVEEQNESLSAGANASRRLLSPTQQINDEEDWLYKCSVQKLVVVISNIESGEVLERWQFDIECDKTAKDDRAWRITQCCLHWRQRGPGNPRFSLMASQPAAAALGPRPHFPESGVTQLLMPRGAQERLEEPEEARLPVQRFAAHVQYQVCVRALVTVTKSHCH
ncbi:hypothetical protein PANDA_012212 [Ailuropoda melanoleuca]|uniref:HORMA domain-containing protein n=1 Tax=Ailuropoda melanoleuca TaxID=9646 RepID=D2HL76_AILME|nr:hypothetical protein PANDA_012212 [Ailuropoda melanoleuca]